MRPIHLSVEYPVFFPQVFDRVLQLLIHPPGNNQQQKAERIYPLRHRLSSLPLRLPPLKIPISVQFKFPDTAGVDAIDVYARFYNRHEIRKCLTANRQARFIGCQVSRDNFGFGTFADGSKVLVAAKVSRWINLLRTRE